MTSNTNTSSYPCDRHSEDCPGLDHPLLRSIAIAKQNKESIMYVRICMDETEFHRRGKMNEGRSPAGGS